MNEKTQPYCKNCDNTINGNYCSNCGQSVKTGQINLHYLIHEIQHSIFHVDKGILYTIKELALRPEKTIKNYLSGKRVNYFKPFAFVIILGTIYGFVAHFFNLYPENEIMPSFDYSGNSFKYGQKSMELIYSKYSFAILALVPFSALSTFLFFRKNKYNYWEHLIINSYIAGMQVFILLIFYLLYVCFKSPWIYFTGSFLAYIYTIWVLVGLFSKNSKLITIIKATSSLIVSFIILMAVVFTISFITILCLHIAGLWKH